MLKKDKIDKAFGAEKKVSSLVSDPFDVLKIRFANGELSVEEFKEKAEVLKQATTIF